MLHILEYRAFALTNHKHAISSLRSRRVLARESIMLSFAKGGHDPYDYYGQRLICPLVDIYPGRERGFIGD